MINRRTFLKVGSLAALLPAWTSRGDSIDHVEMRTFHVVFSTTEARRLTTEGIKCHCVSFFPIKGFNADGTPIRNGRGKRIYIGPEPAKMVDAVMDGVSGMNFLSFTYGEEVPDVGNLRDIWCKPEEAGLGLFVMVNSQPAFVSGPRR